MTIKAPTKKKRCRYEVGFALVGAVGVISVGVIAVRQQVEKTKSQYDYAYLGLDQSSPMVDGMVTFFFVATENLDQLFFSWSKTEDFENPKIPKFLKIFPLIRYGRQDSIAIPIGDWTFDIDAKGRYGKIRQRLIISDNKGKPEIILSRVMRKNGSGTLLCEIPAREGISTC